MLNEEKKAEDENLQISPDEKPKNVDSGPAAICAGLVFPEPAKMVARNPSPGRSRRSGILFKKKQYQPVTPSPLVLFSSSTATSGEESVETSKKVSPLKLRLRVEKPTSKKDTPTPICNENTRQLLTRSKSVDTPRQNGDLTNGSDAHQVSKRRFSSQSHNTRSRDSSTVVNGISPTKGRSDISEIEDDCFYDDYSHIDAERRTPRKRTYTSSSANSDTDMSGTNTRRKSHKRGRQKSAKLSFRQEFGDLEGLDDIKYGIYMINTEESHLLDPKNEPPLLDMLSLIWAKCKGYPSYPALVSSMYLLLVV